MINNKSILNFKRNIYSQNGEDGIINYLVKKLNIKNGVFCELGAWDGIHFSNCRSLALKKWKGIFIEGNINRYNDLIKNYKNNKRIACVHAYVKTDKYNIDKILSKNKIDKLDLISIDIDGLDYEIMKSLKIRPKIICVEVNAGHGGKKSKLIPINIAKNNIGQPLTMFTKLAREMGYKLVAYTGNAFFVYSPDVKTAKLKPASPTEAYRDFLQHLMDIEKEWLMLVNLGIEAPYHPYLSKELFFWNLGIPFRKTTKLIIDRIYLKYKSIK